MTNTIEAASCPIAEIALKAKQEDFDEGKKRELREGAFLLQLLQEGRGMHNIYLLKFQSMSKSQHF